MIKICFLNKINSDCLLFPYCTHCYCVLLPFLHVLLFILFIFFEGGKVLQWEFVHGLLENAIYGGRIDNPSDLRILRSYLEQFFSSRLLSSSAGQRKSKGSARVFPSQISLPNSCSILVCFWDKSYLYTQKAKTI